MSHLLFLGEVFFCFGERSCFFCCFFVFFETLSLISLQIINNYWVYPITYIEMLMCFCMFLLHDKYNNWVNTQKANIKYYCLEPGALLSR